MLHCSEAKNSVEASTFMFLINIITQFIRTAIIIKTVKFLSRFNIKEQAKEHSGGGLTVLPG